MSKCRVAVVTESSSSTHGCDCLTHRFGNAADRPERRPRYGSDMSDAEWAVVKDLLPVPGWPAGRGGRPEGYCHRQMIDAVRCLVDNGIKWRAMPADFPPWPHVCAFFTRRRDAGLVTELHDRLREAVRVGEGRSAEPSAGVVDSQSVKAACRAVGRMNPPGFASTGRPRSTSLFNRAPAPSTRQAQALSQPSTTAARRAPSPSYPGPSPRFRSAGSERRPYWLPLPVGTTAL
ncbi:hypothetical protein CW362_19755 [Streptomyces populi]|uniref:Insertion element IS402-like domain-containing protein n=1 Tax=Streptomyces populi TaxID=2058924 RepID=A0A2I0SN28_9ACTN|nr:hypothetical protein CW362_19755 [Streptomyces populi]